MRILPTQQGVALITVLLVVVIATVAASAMTFTQQLDIRRSARVLELGQARVLGDGVESWARQVIARDDAGSDHPGELWANLPPAIPVEGWLLGASLSDLQSRFNLNNLVNSDDTPNVNALAQFRRLLQSQKIDPELAFAVVDWIDVNNEPAGVVAAEDDYYLAQQPGRRAANRWMAHVSELRLIRGFDALRPEPMSALLALVTALPATSHVNINTARPVVLAAMVEGLSESAARQWQQGGPYLSKVDALRSEAIAKRPTAEEEKSIDVNTGYFMLRASARRDDAGVTLQREFYSMLVRVGANKARVNARGEVAY